LTSFLAILRIVDAVSLELNDGPPCDARREKKRVRIGEPVAFVLSGVLEVVLNSPRQVLGSKFYHIPVLRCGVLGLAY